MVLLSLYQVMPFRKCQSGTYSLVSNSITAIHTCLIGEIAGCGTFRVCRPAAFLVFEGRAVRIHAVIGPVCGLLGRVALFIDVSGEEGFPALRRLLGPFLEVSLGGLEALLLLFRHVERSRIPVKFQGLLRLVVA